MLLKHSAVELRHGCPNFTQTGFTQPQCKGSPFTHPTTTQRSPLTQQRCISQGKEFLPAAQTRTASIIPCSQQGPFHTAPATHQALHNFPSHWCKKQPLTASHDQGSWLGYFLCVSEQFLFANQFVCSVAKLHFLMPASVPVWSLSVISGISLLFFPTHLHFGCLHCHLADMLSSPPCFCLLYTISTKNRTEGRCLCSPKKSNSFCSHSLHIPTASYLQLSKALRQIAKP